MPFLTKTAIDRVKQLIERRGKGDGIRIGVKTTGCSGLAYTLEYVDKYTYNMSDVNYSQAGLCVLVDKKHEAYLKGMTVDWVRNGLNEGFEFRNPNERDRCGCGVSFRV